MASSPLADADREMLLDLQRAAEALRIDPCLIGASAILLALQRRTAAPLSRTTRDWDFAVAVESWQTFHDLAALLTAAGGGFHRVTEPHRFVHRLGGTLDVVPFGSLESPVGTIRWPDGSAMSTVGFAVLERHHEVHDLGQGLKLRVASLPALAGLKLLAYGDRRPAILRDIRDLHHLARSHAWDDGEGRIDAVAETALHAGVVGFGEVGAYVLGRAIAAAFASAPLVRMGDLLVGADDPWSDVVEHVVRERRGPIEERDRELVCACLGALRSGIAGK